LSTTRVVVSASTLAGSNAATSAHAFGAVFGADEIWDGFGVFGGIGGLSVTANAGVVKGSGITTICFGG